MEVVERVDDKQVLQRFDGLVHVKLREAEQFPDAVQTWSCTKGHERASFVLSDADGLLSVKIVHDSRGRHEMSFAEFDDGDDPSRLPAYELFIDDEKSLVVGFGAAKDNAPGLSEMLDKVEAAQTSINELVPYGWVDEDGCITMVMFCGQFQVDKKGDYWVNDFGLDSYVLQGKQLPIQLRMSADKPGWMTTVWQQIADGRLVRLSERMSSLDGQVFARGDGTDMGYIEFDSSDGQKPAFAVNARYVDWHPRENFPGEFFLKWDTSKRQQPYENNLAGYFC